MDDTSSLRTFCAVSYCPLPDLIFTSGEEACEVERLAHGSDNLWKRRLSAELLALLSCFFVRHGRKPFLKACRDENDLVTCRMLLDPLSNLGKMLVSTSEVVFLAQIDEVDHGLSGQQEQGIDDLDLKKALAGCPNRTYDIVKSDVLYQSWTSFQVALRELCGPSKSWDYRAIALVHPFKCGGGDERFTAYLFRAPVALSDIFAILEPLKNFLNCGLLLLEFLHLQTLSASAGLLDEFFKGLLDELNVLDTELLADDVQVPSRVDVTLNVDDLCIIETSNDLEDGIDGTDV